MTLLSIAKIRMIAFAVLLLLSAMTYAALRKTVTPNSIKAMFKKSSGPNKRMAAENLHKWVFGIYILLSSVTVVAGIAVWKTGNSVQEAIQDENDYRMVSLAQRANEATEQAVKAAEDLQRLQSQVEGRRLSHEQFIVVRNALLVVPIRHVQVVCPSGNAEAYGYAKQLQSTLEAAHFRTGAGILKLDNAWQNTGITLFVGEDHKEEREGAKQIRDALATAGIHSSINVRNSLPFLIRIYVGPRS